jgi:hypothetical protein
VCAILVLEVGNDVINLLTAVPTLDKLDLPLDAVGLFQVLDDLPPINHLTTTALVAVGQVERALEALETLAERDVSDVIICDLPTLAVTLNELDEVL